MRTTTWTLYVFVGLVALCHVGFSSPIVKRQVLDNPAYIDPAQQDLDSHEDNDRGKRKIEGAVELTYGVKNAVLGLFFNKLNAFIDHKTNWVNQLDQLNVAKNKQYGIESPKDPITSFGNVFGSHTYKQLLRKPFHLLHKRAIGVTPTPKMPTTTEDLVVFNPGEKVSLQVPDQLFGSGFSLITNISQIIGSVIQDAEDEWQETLDERQLSDPSVFTLNLKSSQPNSAERTAKIFEAMKPFLQTVFGVNSLKVTRDGPANNKI